MRKILTKAATVAFMAGTLIAGGAGVAPIANAAVPNMPIPPTGPACSSGFACLYQNPTTNGFIGKYYTYGYHNLSNVLGDHYFVNDQTGGAKAYLCTGYNGTGTCTLIPAGSGGDYNFTPINSIYLHA